MRSRVSTAVSLNRALSEILKETAERNTLKRPDAATEDPSKVTMQYIIIHNLHLYLYEYLQSMIYIYIHMLSVLFLSQFQFLH